MFSFITGYCRFSFVVEWFFVGDEERREVGMEREE